MHAKCEWTYVLSGMTTCIVFFLTFWMPLKKLFSESHSCFCWKYFGDNIEITILSPFLYAFQFVFIIVLLPFYAMTKYSIVKYFIIHSFGFTDCKKKISNKITGCLNYKSNEMVTLHVLHLFVRFWYFYVCNKSFIVQVVKVCKRLIKWGMHAMQCIHVHVHDIIIAFFIDFL